MEFASRSVPGPLSQTNQKPSPLATGNCSLRSPRAPRQSSSLPGPSQASSTFTEGLIPSVQAHLVPPEALLSCQHFLHSSLDIPASRACVRNAALRAGPAGGPPAPNCCPHLPAGPTSRISFSPFQNVGARHDLQETEGEALKGARIKMDQPST